MASRLCPMLKSQRDSAAGFLIEDKVLTPLHPVVRRVAVELPASPPLRSRRFPSTASRNKLPARSSSPHALAFFSWFFDSKSIGIHRWFSDNDTFTTDAGPVCVTTAASTTGLVGTYQIGHK